jgi:glycosyltransferase involved in cell wall biosynthesis
MLSIIMPVYNEKNTVEQAFERVKRLPIDKEIILVDDFSTDGTREIIKGFQADKVRVLFHEKNRGKGAAIRTALKAVAGDMVIIQDADLEYNPEEIPKLVRPIELNQADIVYGSRFLGTHEKKYFNILYLGNRFLTLLTALFFGKRVTDMETCYKVFRTRIIRSFNLKSDRFDFEPEVTAKTLKGHYRFMEIPIGYKGRSYTEGKKIGWKDGVGAIAALLKYKFSD